MTLKQQRRLSQWRRMHRYNKLLKRAIQRQQDNFRDNWQIILNHFNND